ncbi:MAG: hypothetical protein IPL53_09655 [Ignavibacteria bacterium]|nr:hypothetical protein [Ignavibacteria bacterium]
MNRILRKLKKNPADYSVWNYL